MTDGASTEVAGAKAGGPIAPMPNAADKPSAVPPAAMPEASPITPPNVRFANRTVPPATAEERLMREEGMARALRNGATPYRDAEGKGRHIPFKEANLAPVEPWVRDPRAKRGYRRTQELRKAAGQLIGQPGDMIEIAKRLGELHWEQGSDIEGAARRGLHDAIWSREHVYDTFTVLRRYGRTLIDTGRVAAVAEEEARKLQAEDPKARGGFWVRDRNNHGLLYVVPNPDPAEEAAVAEPAFEYGAAAAEDEVLLGSGGQNVVHGQPGSGADDHTTMAKTADILPAPDAESTVEPEKAQDLQYPNIPLPRPEPSWQVSEDAEAGSDELPVINMEADRIKNILANEPAVFEIKDWANATAERPWYASHLEGYLAVLVYEPVIEYVCKLYDVDPSIVKAVMYVENAHGGFYGRQVERFDRAKTILPMNINPTTWGALVGPNPDFSDPLTNVMAGVIMIRRIWERIPEPTVAKVASNYKFTGMENVSDYGARVAKVYETRLWEEVPAGFTDRDLENAPASRAYIQAHRRRREKLEQQLPD